jgi:protein Tex
VHISELADKYVSDPAEVVKVQQRVMATVLEVDLERHRISLSLRSGPSHAPHGVAKGGTPERGKAPAPGRQNRPPPGKGPAPNNPFADALSKL